MKNLGVTSSVKILSILFFVFAAFLLTGCDDPNEEDLFGKNIKLNSETANENGGSTSDPEPIIPS